MSVGATNGKGPDGHTIEGQSPGSKQIKVVETTPGLAAVDISKAPPSRRYTRDYAKVTPDRNDDDLVGPVLGPLRW